ncbi:peptidylprolyl isomerase [Chitinophaga terrae (ex Kim and Jung 2007)]|jgi:peptidylprolyl isomerase|uniref:Peptidyl-prolyl cis-trans isomerase n=1 Tax=Chitinophaga terrae (ex Kim and Jung 2007) TaxID=408074 RepID=A0A1H4BZE8_9BACT|nr:FKBP-type peptidyl-prolyl cis-trans isomerase [Chitinophaga terrae (ex Kim and Jung 2007)]MDQ0108590.1 peptidylprolyl isomerase [Chitinophaga terrae (ex Kim and Jung 2007)]GEP91941.1 peptidyl-prolyl cis-trans isomerase [Chitinophaga terrae (ex Kim and Jung 2007)]SEA53575.1 peptidylprolyl isomerase [Chitinophaga terrae (ex Kim and Jung 2007)]
MQTVKNGDTVKVHYHGRLTNGTTFDSSEGRDPLEFKVGAGMVIKGFENGVLEMKVGDKKTIHIPVDQAYGPKSEEMIIEFPKENMPPDMNPQIGDELQMSNPQGQVFLVKVVGISDAAITLDANHALAGEDLIFDLELVEIK